MLRLLSKLSPPELNRIEWLPTAWERSPSCVVAGQPPPAPTLEGNAHTQGAHRGHENLNSVPCKCRPLRGWPVTKPSFEFYLLSLPSQLWGGLLGATTHREGHRGELSPRSSQSGEGIQPKANRRQPGRCGGSSAGLHEPLRDPWNVPNGSSTLAGDDTEAPG